MYLLNYYVGRIIMTGYLSLTRKEVYRFLSIWLQTLLGPLTTALLYQLIFGHQFAQVKTGIVGVSYTMFLIPGLVIMQVLLNAFGNGSSSFIQSKYTGNIIYVLMAPITPLAIYSAYLTASIIRGVLVGFTIYAGIALFSTFILPIAGVFILPKAPLALLFFLIVGASVTAGLGLIAGIMCDKFDQLAGFQSFIMVPLVYLAGVFFNPLGLPGIWQKVATCNPFLYIVDGFRYGFIAHTDYNLGFGVGFVLTSAIVVNLVGFLLIKRGIRVKH